MQDPALVLLDRFYQAASFPELVLALQTRSGAATVDYSCGDEMVTLDAADASRPMISAVLHLPQEPIQPPFRQCPNFHMPSMMT
ncbi:MAG: hypothetical protein ACPIOQ_67665 [Promethearchaeia archaeon]